jgi:hypothetical protein
MPTGANRGVTLFETVAAITIVSMVAISALEAAGAGLRTVERSRRAVETDALATARLDFMNLLTDQELLALPDSVKKGQFDPPMNGYGWQTSSEPVSGSAGVYDIAITITWPGNRYLVRTAQYRRPAVTTASR